MGTIVRNQKSGVRGMYILHGWSTSNKRWDDFLQTLTNEKIPHTFLKIPGLSAPLEHPWNLNDYVEWLNALIPKNEKAIILGHSNGGRIALAFAHKYPARVRQLFLIDSAGIYHNDLLIKTKRKVFKVVSSIGKHVTKSEKARNLIYKIAQENDYKDATPVMKETMKNLIQINLQPILKEIQTPTVIIWGKNDLVTPFKDAVLIKDYLPNSLLYPISGGRHSPQFTHTQEVVDIIKKSL